MTVSVFNPETIPWQTLEGIAHLAYALLDVDVVNNTADVLFKFAAGQQIVLHRHKALNHMLVLRGEHRLYNVAGELIESRPTGRYTVSPPSAEPHREGGGAEDVVILFSIRGSADGLLYEILADDLNVIGEITMQTLQALFVAQQQSDTKAG